MKRVKIGFDLGNSSMKIAALHRGGPELYEVPLPEHLMEEDTIAMPHAFSAFLKRIKRSLGLPGGPAGLILPASQVICRLAQKYNRQAPLLSHRPQIRNRCYILPHLRY